MVLSLRFFPNSEPKTVKKLLIVIVVAILLVIFISPGLVGRVAEESVNQQLAWAAEEGSSGELGVRLESFDRHWFSSDSVHYVTLGDGQLREMLEQDFGLVDTSALPVLKVETRVDHGLIPLSSIHREGGSLSPAIASARSTMTLEMGDGSSFPIPGAIYSNLGFGGDVESRYFVPAGEAEAGTWQDVDILVTGSPTANSFVVDAILGGGTVTDEGQTVEFGKLTVKSNQAMGNNGMYLGDTTVRLESVRVANPGAPEVTIGPVVVDASVSELGETLNQDVQMAIDVPNAPMLGDVNFRMDVEILGADAVALNNLNERLGSLDDSLPPYEMYAVLEPDLVRLVSRGFTFNLKRFDFEMPQGPIDTELSIVVPQSDPASFSWGNVVQSMSGEASLIVPAAIFNMAMMASPEAQSLVAMGMLIEDGDTYVMDAAFEQGLLSVNGNPMPLPLPGN